MSNNPFADDPTIQSEYFEGRWISKGRTLTTHDVNKLQVDLANKVARISSQRTLSQEAKLVAIARAYRETRDAIAEQGRQVVQQAEAKRAQLGRKLFGHEGDADPQTVIVRRDAADRAAKLKTPEEASSALQQAEVNGDRYMAQAIATHAWTHSWNDVLSGYLDARPEAAETVSQLREVPDTNNPVWMMQHAMTYHVAKPAELGERSDWQVDALADTVLDGPTAA